MAYDEALAQRVRQILARQRDVEEKRMFGGLCFMVSGRMCCGVDRTGLILRLPVEKAEAALREPHVKVFDMTGRPLAGFVLVGPKSCERADQVARWLEPAIAHALASARDASKVGRKPAVKVSAKRKPPARRVAHAKAH